MKLRLLSLMTFSSIAFFSTPVFAEDDPCEAASTTYNTCSYEMPVISHCQPYYGSSYCWSEPDYQWLQDCLDLFQQFYEECQRIQQEQNQPPILPTPDPYPNGDGPTPYYPEDDECPEDTTPLPTPGGQIACSSSSSSSSSGYSTSSSGYSDSSSGGYGSSSSYSSSTSGTSYCSYYGTC